MTRWEYVRQVVTHEHVLDVCRLGGAQGWELAGMLEVNLQTAVIVPGQEPVAAGCLLLFKRPVPEQASAPPVNRDSHAAAVEHLFTR